jgi:pimeloyl-ACP methyl ester carboxylesterase
MVATADQMIPPDAERFMAERAGAHTIVEVEASHSIAVSQPAAVADLIRSAVRTSA